MKRPIIDKRLITAATGTWLLIICFDILWCSATTFRAMSFPGLWLNAALLALITTLPYKLTSKIWVHGVMLTLLAGLFESNLMYCRTYYSAIPPESYLIANNLADFGASVADSMRWPDISLAGVIIATLSIMSGTAATTSRLRNAGYIAAMAVFGVVCIGISMLYGGPRKHIDNLTEACYYTTTPPAIYTVPGYLIKSVTDPANETATPETRAIISQWIADKRATRPFKALPDSVTRRKNLAIILCESLESWPLQSMIEGVEITPNLNRLICDSTSFYAPNMLTQVASGRSIDAQLLFNAGMLPMEKSVYAMHYSDRRYPSLSDAMHRRGARTYIITGDKPITWNQSRIATAFNTDTLLCDTDWENGVMIGHPAKLSDVELARQSAKKMRDGEIWPEGEEAFALWVTYSGHNPFILPTELRDPQLEAVIPSSWPKRLQDYVRMAHYTDTAVGELVNSIRNRNDADSTLILITGDHEGLGSDRKMMHAASDGLVSNGPFTPFLLINSPIAGRDDRIMGQADMYPTLLSLMGLETYPWKGMGENILMPREAPAAISTMTREIYGDTTGINKDALKNLQEARHISDVMIRTAKTTPPQ